MVLTLPTGLILVPVTHHLGGHQLYSKENARA